MNKHPTNTQIEARLIAQQRQKCRGSSLGPLVYADIYKRRNRTTNSFMQFTSVGNCLVLTCLAPWLKMLKDPESKAKDVMKRVLENLIALHLPVTSI